MSDRNPLPLIITAICSTLGSVLVLFDTAQKGLSGVLVDNRKQAVRCLGEETPQRVE